MMTFVIIVVLLFFKGIELIPKRWQSVYECLENYFYYITVQNLSNVGLIYFSFIVSLFVFLVFLNILGLCPYVFTPTTHIIVTLGFYFSIVIGVTFSGFYKFKKTHFNAIQCNSGNSRQSR